MGSSCCGTPVFSKGDILKSSDADFAYGLKAAVDYRGDVSVCLTDGSLVEGYIFNQTDDRLDLFPKNSPRAVSVRVRDIDSVTFSGEDTASGKSYDDWVQKKESEKAAIMSRPIELT